MLRSRRGQIVIPAMLLFPTLFLFVYLIYETAKLSREKIRHQFAMDAAAFVEMTNYSDFLNRSAYVNGAFPMRIFEEGFNDYGPSCKGPMGTTKSNVCNEWSYTKLLFDNGAFPDVDGEYSEAMPGPVHKAMPVVGQWNIAYSHGSRGHPSFDYKNSPDPDMDRFMPTVPPDESKYYELFTKNDADNYFISYENGRPSFVGEAYSLYIQIYGLLGSVESAQFSVLKRLTADHSFLVKSYWLNTGDSDGGALKTAFNNTALGDFNSAVKPACLRKLTLWGNRSTGNPYNPFSLVKSVGDADGGIDMTGSGVSQLGCESQDNGRGGLFQLESMDTNMVNEQQSGKIQTGFDIEMPWSVPAKNFFNVDFAGMMAQRFPGRYLHTNIMLAGAPGMTPNVWPKPTPKFQVRQNP